MTVPVTENPRYDHEAFARDTHEWRKDNFWSVFLGGRVLIETMPCPADYLTHIPRVTEADLYPIYRRPAGFVGGIMTAADLGIEP